MSPLPDASWWDGTDFHLSYLTGLSTVIDSAHQEHRFRSDLSDGKHFTPTP